MSRFFPLLVVAGLVVLAGGCGDDAAGASDARAADGRTTTNASPTDGGNTADGATAADAGTTDGADGELSCDRGAAFPAQLPFDRACGRSEDCFVANHMIDCCGTIRAIGMNKAEQTRFTTAERQCAATFPLCGCSTDYTITDRGSVSAMATIEVTCDHGTCSTFGP
jgi:hypothetical protein